MRRRSIVQLPIVYIHTHTRRMLSILFTRTMGAAHSLLDGSMIPPPTYGRSPSSPTHSRHLGAYGASQMGLESVDLMPSLCVLVHCSRPLGTLVTVLVSAPFVPLSSACIHHRHLLSILKHLPLHSLPPCLLPP